MKVAGQTVTCGGKRTTELNDMNLETHACGKRHRKGLRGHGGKRSLKEKNVSFRSGSEA